MNESLRARKKSRGLVNDRIRSEEINAAFALTSNNFEVSFISPLLAPAVLDEPVWKASFYAVANEEPSVIEISLTADGRVRDTFAVKLEGLGVKLYWKRADESKSLGYSDFIWRDLNEIFYTDKTIWRIVLTLIFDRFIRVCSVRLK